MTFRNFSKDVDNLIDAKPAGAQSNILREYVAPLITSELLVIKSATLVDLLDASQCTFLGKVIALHNALAPVLIIGIDENSEQIGVVP